MVKKALTHRERIEMCLGGERPDQVPVALWRHFPVDDQTPGGLAAACTNFQRMYDFDFLKVTPASSFCLRDWGVKDIWRGNTEGTRDYFNHVVNKPEDWEKLPILDPHKGALGAQLECLKLLKSEFGNDLPILQTIFSPLAQAKHLVAPDQLPIHIHRYPDALEIGLRRITETTQRFTEAALQTGISGLFYAVQHAQYGLLSAAEFVRFGKIFDLNVLETSQSAWFNLLHIHGDNLIFDQLLDYPVQALNWHDRQTPPSLSEAQSRFPGAVCGGLRQWDTMVLDDPVQILIEAKDAFAQTHGRRFILGTGCVLPITTPHGNLVAVLDAIRNTRVDQGPA
ncbi:MAG: uroporphyrinogen decarboxylase family protein [Anaerolineaceae bacterium]|nr:uroporphyrinogen decarboxylase family protein [Anaerolineaceae bacterium]